MASEISPENEQFIQHELESGVYLGRGQLLDEAVSLLKRRRIFNVRFRPASIPAQAFTPTRSSRGLDSSGQLWFVRPRKGTASYYGERQRIPFHGPWANAVTATSRPRT